MTIKIALAGNPNSGKTTMFNMLTGSNQRVGNWPGVTVEKKEGKLKGRSDVIIQDLPGIYSLSPYTLEEVVSRSYLITEQPDAIINIIDASNMERNLYLTTQLLELGIPVVIALNMIDIVRKKGIIIDCNKLSEQLGCAIVETSAVKKDGCDDAVSRAIELALKKKTFVPRHEFSDEIEQALDDISARLETTYVHTNYRWHAVKVFERDREILQQLNIEPSVWQKINTLISSCEEQFDDDSESIITSERYQYITTIIDDCLFNNGSSPSTSAQIDKVVTNRVMALPIFAAIMFMVYYLSITTVGTMMTDMVNDEIFGDGFHLYGGAAYEQQVESYEASLNAFPPNLEQPLQIEEPDPKDYGLWIPGIPALTNDWLKNLAVAEWLRELIVSGIIAGVGAVLGFLPQMLVLFLCLAILEDCGYMARAAFIMDRIFRNFGLSGKSFIPILIGTGCAVPGIMASRTIENEGDRRMTVITTTFIPCSAKLPIIALIAGALFNDAGWVAASAYFLGIAAVMISGIMLKKTKLFSGDLTPFVMELPTYHVPGIKSVLKTTWCRGFSFVKKAGTIVLASTTLIWFLSNFTWTLDMVDTNSSDSILSGIGNTIAPLFAPLGWGDWKAAVATITGLLAKENVVGTFGVLFGFANVSEEGMEYWDQLRTAFTPLSAYSFLMFNLLCAPCFAAIGAVRREMMSAKWTWFALLYQTTFAYCLSLIFYQTGMAVKTSTFTIGAGFACAVALILLYGLIRKPQHPQQK